jgi:A1 cistron-splicing factor AAR2
LFGADGFVDSQDDQLEAELSRATKIIDRQQKEEKEKADKEAQQQATQKPRNTGTIQEVDEIAEMETDLTEETMPNAEKQEVVPAASEVVKHGMLAKFTPIDLRSSFRKGAVGEEVTRYSLDKSWLLNNLFTTVYKSGMCFNHYFRFACENP